MSEANQKPRCCKCGACDGYPHRCRRCGHYHGECCVEAEKKATAEHDAIMRRVRGSRQYIASFLAGVASVGLGYGGGFR